MVDGDEPLPLKGRGVYFDGTDDYLSIAGLIMSPDHTLTAWVKLENIETLFNIVNASNTDNTNFLYFRGNENQENSNLN